MLTGRAPWGFWRSFGARGPKSVRIPVTQANIKAKETEQRERGQMRRLTRACSETAGP